MTRCSAHLVETPPTCLALVTVMAAAVIVYAPSLAAGTSTTPAASPLAPEVRDALVERASTLPRLRSLIVSVDDEIVEEHYFNGASVSALANVKSVSKTIISILVGIAIDQGLLAGVEQPITDFFGDELEEAGPAKRAITLEDLLTMRSGLETTSNRNYGRWVHSPHWVRHVLSRPMVEEPRGPMIYSTGNTHLLSAIVTKASGVSTLTFGRRYLTEPLGITLPAWLRDPQGIYFGGNEMQLTPRAMIEIGELYLRRGTVDGRELVSKEWIRASLVPRTQSRYSHRHYGYGWWLRTVAGFSTHYAWGYGGQFIFVIPDLDAVVVATSSPLPGEGRRTHRRDLDALIERQLIPEIARARAVKPLSRGL